MQNQQQHNLNMIYPSRILMGGKTICGVLNRVKNICVAIDKVHKDITKIKQVQIYMKSVFNYE